MNAQIFNDMPFGQIFKAPNNISYIKKSDKQAQVLITPSGERINNGKYTSNFYNSKLQLELLDL